MSKARIISSLSVCAVIGAACLLGTTTAEQLGIGLALWALMPITKLT